jgi:hypothetical protein
MTVAYLNRRFQVWEYRVSHGMLLIRSPKGLDAETNVDIVFSGTSYISCPRLIRGLELIPVKPEDVERVRAGFELAAPPSEVFVLLSEARRHLVIAASCRVSENMNDIFDIPFV